MPTPGNIIRFTTTPAGAEQFAAFLEQALRHVLRDDTAAMWIAGGSEEESTTFFSPRWISSLRS